MEEKVVPHGGQALIEGVMMRGKDKIAIACRRPNNEIIIEDRPLNTITKRFPFLKLPILRGVVMFIETMVIGIQALTFSASQQAETEEEELGGWALFLTILLALGVGLLFFIVAPAAVARLVNPSLGNGIATLNIIEAIIRVSLFLLYILMISRMKDIHRVFQYHGAEHKTINAFEAGDELTVCNVQKYSTLHPRCGTSFLLIVMVISIFVFAMLGKQPLWLRIISKISLMPLVAGISYEFLRLSGKFHKAKLVKILIAPGLGLQKLTTREPDDRQVEVAICALQSVLKSESD